MFFGGCTVDLPINAEKALSITDFSPKTGGEKTAVVVNGKNFATSPELLQVKMGNYSMKPLTVSALQLTFLIPEGIPTGEYNIRVLVDGKEVTSSEKFIVDTNIPGSDFINNYKVPITSLIVNTCFVGTGQNNIHPRLFFSSSDIQRIKSLIQTDIAAKAAYDEIIKNANTYLTQSLYKYGLDAAKLRISGIHPVGSEVIPALVLAYQFTGDTRYAKRCWDQLAEMLTWPDWGANRHFLDVGIGSKGVAMAYDGLYDYLSISQKSQLVAAARKYALEPGLLQMTGNTSVWAWYQSTDNWNGICHGGLIDLALSMYETDNQFMSNVISYAANGMILYMKSFEPDGASEEGIAYWDYGLINTCLCFDAMTHVLSTTYGLAEQPGFAKTGWFPFLVTGPAGTASIGDDDLYNGKAYKYLSRFWFAKHFNDANLAKVQYQATISKLGNKLNGWNDLFNYDPSLVSQGQLTAMPMTGHVRGLNYMFVRENETDESYYIGMHDGDNNASHGHLDAGNFFLHAKGEVFATGSLGNTHPYPADYFDITSPDYFSDPTNIAPKTGRFYYYRIRTEGKSCLVFNPDARPMQNPLGIAIEEKDASSAEGAYYVTNLTPNYCRDVSSYRRGIKINRTSRVTTVQDEFTTKATSTVYWLMHTAAIVSVISSNKKIAKLTIGAKSIYAILKSPVDAEFEYISSSTKSINYLEETKPVFSTIMSVEDQNNGTYGKLQFKLTGINGSKTIRVDFVDEISTTVPDLVSFTNWNIGN